MRPLCAFLAQGGNGCISVTSNVAPGLCQAMYLALRQGQLVEAQWLATTAATLTAALSCESNPAPVKYALALVEHDVAARPFAARRAEAREQGPD